MNTIKNLFIRYKELIMYVIMGGATTVVNWIVYAIMVSLLNSDNTLFGFDFNLLISNITAWIASVIFAYVTNKIFVFESHSWTLTFVLKEFTLFVSSRLVTGLLEIVGVPFLVGLGLDQTIMGIDGMVSKILISVLVVVLNYVFSKLFIFRKSDNNK